MVVVEAAMHLFDFLTQNLGPLSILFAPTLAIRKHLIAALLEEVSEESSENIEITQ